MQTSIDGRDMRNRIGKDEVGLVRTSAELSAQHLVLQITQPSPEGPVPTPYDHLTTLLTQPQDLARVDAVYERVIERVAFKLATHNQSTWNAEDFLTPFVEALHIDEDGRTIAEKVAHALQSLTPDERNQVSRFIDRRSLSRTEATLTSLRGIPKHDTTHHLWALEDALDAMVHLGRVAFMAEVPRPLEELAFTFSVIALDAIFTGKLSLEYLHDLKQLAARVTPPAEAGHQPQDTPALG